MLAHYERRRRRRSLGTCLPSLPELAPFENLHRTRRLLLACERASASERPTTAKLVPSLPPPPFSSFSAERRRPPSRRRRRAASSVTIARRGSQKQQAPRFPPSLSLSPAAPLVAGVTRLALLATTFVLRLLRATLEAAKRLLLRCFRPHIEEEADARAKYSAAARGLSVMREAELTDAAAAPLVVRSPSSSVETVTIGLLASSVASPPASPSSPSHSSSASMATSTSSSSAADAALDKREEPTNAITSPVLVGKGRRIKPFPPLDDDSNGSSSNGSAGAHSEAKHTRSLTSQQDLDQRRNSFSAMTADGRAQLRRRSHDFTDYASYTLPPPGSSAGFLHARSKNHVHMRMYGKADTVPLKRVTARQAEGAALVDVICPSARTIWRRGQPVSIEWKVLDAEVQNVQIELMEEGSSATTTITKSTANSGFFMYPKVPWGMQVGPTYFLRISSAADPSRYMTTVFFSIGSAP